MTQPQIELKACPNECDTDRVKPVVYVARWTIACHSCGMSGPSADTAGIAAQRWNLLPRSRPQVAPGLRDLIRDTMLKRLPRDPVKHPDWNALLTNDRLNDLADAVAIAIAADIAAAQGGQVVDRDDKWIASSQRLFRKTQLAQQIIDEIVGYIGTDHLTTKITAMIADFETPAGGWEAGVGRIIDILDDQEETSPVDGALDSGKLIQYISNLIEAAKTQSVEPGIGERTFYKALDEKIVLADLLAVMLRGDFNPAVPSAPGGVLRCAQCQHTRTNHEHLPIDGLASPATYCGYPDCPCKQYYEQEALGQPQGSDSQRLEMLIEQRCTVEFDMRSGQYYLFRDGQQSTLKPTPREAIDDWIQKRAAQPVTAGEAKERGDVTIKGL